MQASLVGGVGFCPSGGQGLLRGIFLAHSLLVGGAIFPLCWLLGLSMQVADWGPRSQCQNGDLQESSYSWVFPGMSTSGVLTPQ